MEKGETKKNFKEFIANAGQKAKDIAEDAGHKAKDFAEDAGQKAKGIADNAIKAIDQDDDGKFNISDVSIIAENVGHIAKKGANAVAEGAHDAAKELERKMLAPLFPEDLIDSEFMMPKLIRIMDRDKKHADNELCQGSIGFTQSPKGHKIVNIFRDSLDAFGLSFYPNAINGFYYVDPIESNLYIALDEYFDFLKSARISELQVVAQSLGAKHFKVTYKEERKTFAEVNAVGKANATKNINANAEHITSQTQYVNIKVASEMSFPGQEATRPDIKYLRNEPHIKNLIHMRMDEKSPLLEQHMEFQLSKTSGMKETDAANVDTILKALKCTGNMTLESEVKNEERRFLEYDVKF